MAENAIEIPIWGDELKDFMNIGSTSSPNWIEVTHLLNWEFDDDEEAYEPEYIDSKEKQKIITSSSASIGYEKDAYKNNALDAFLMAHEDDNNIPVEVCRVRTWENNSAKKAPFMLTPKQLDKGNFGEPIKLKGSLNKNGEWKKGKWQDNGFVAEEAPAGPGSGSTESSEQVAG